MQVIKSMAPKWSLKTKSTIHLIQRTSVMLPFVLHHPWYSFERCRYVNLYQSPPQWRIPLQLLMIYRKANGLIYIQSDVHFHPINSSMKDYSLWCIVTTSTLAFHLASDIRTNCQKIWSQDDRLIALRPETWRISFCIPIPNIKENGLSVYIHHHPCVCTPTQKEERKTDIPNFSSAWIGHTYAWNLLIYTLKVGQSK